MKKIIILIFCVLSLTAASLKRDGQNRLLVLKRQILETSPTLWLDASNTDKIEFDTNHYVKYWYNEILVAKYLKQTTDAGYRPHYTNLRNGYHFITYTNNATQILDSNFNGTDIWQADSKSFCLIIKPVDTSALIFYLPDADYFSLAYISSNQLRIRNDDGALDELFVNTPNDRMTLLCVTHDGTNIKAYTQEDNDSVASGATQSLNSYIRFGHISAHMQGEFEEFIAWDKVITDNQRQKIVDYSKRKWGIE